MTSLHPEAIPKQLKNYPNFCLWKLEERDGRETKVPTEKGKSKIVQPLITLTVTEVLQEAFESKHGAKIKALYYGNWSEYPSQSEADLALCSHLAFWLKGDAAAINAAFRESWLYRDKWNEKHHGDGRTYGEATIEKAITFYTSSSNGLSQEERPQEDPFLGIPDPIPFSDEADLPEFPIEAIPDATCRDMVIEISRVMQIDPGFTACCLFGTISAAAQGKFEIDLCTHREYPNGYFMGVLDSGERKSPTAKAMFKPIHDFEASKREKVAITVRDARNTRTVKANRLKKLQRAAAKDQDETKLKAAKNSDKEKVKSAFTEAEELAKELAENPEPTLPVYVLNDVTTEKLAIIMAENGERMNILSAEGGIFDILAGRYSNGTGGNIDLYLQAYSHEPVSIQRVGRDPVYLREPSLTVCLGVQPSVIEDIGNHKRFRGRGLLARFLCAKCKPQAGNRPRLSEAVDESIVKRFNERITALMDVQFSETVTVKLDSAAQKLQDAVEYDRLTKANILGVRLKKVSSSSRNINKKITNKNNTLQQM